MLRRKIYGNPKKYMVWFTFRNFEFSFFIFYSLIIGIIFAFIGLLLSSKGLREIKIKGLSGKGEAITGQILSIIGLIFGFIKLLLGYKS